MIEDDILFSAIIENCYTELCKATNYNSWYIKEASIINKRPDNLYLIERKNTAFSYRIKQLQENLYSISGFFTHNCKIRAEFNLTFAKKKEYLN